MPENELTAERIRTLLHETITNKENCGFAAYIVAKSEPKLREMILDEGNHGPSNYKKIVRDTILDVMNEKYLAEGVEFVSASNVADDQRKYYVIRQDEGYKPFDYLSTDLAMVSEFKHEMIDDASGIAFWFRHGETEFWAYQHLWSIMVPNKKKTHSLAVIKSYESHDYFEEQVDTILTIASKVDVLIIDNNIITSNISLMQTSFSFQDFIVATAQKSIDRIVEKQVISNPGKLTDYINRGKTSKYAKKMMRIANSKVLDLSKEELMNKIHSLDRWKDKFEEDDNGAILLNTYPQVENLIDLLDERFTRSDVTEQEYDTDVKQIAEPVSIS